MKKQEPKTPLFRLGDIYITPGAQAALIVHAVNPATLLDRHVTGDWSNRKLAKTRKTRGHPLIDEAQRAKTRGHALIDEAQSTLEPA